jgi:hypothetical protein
MTFSRVEHAVRNNAIWCDTLCRVHGTPGEFHAAAWLNRHAVPRFYPNVVTLSPQREAAAQLAYIQDLLAANLPAPWAVKDSFYVLDLGALGFQLLFEATWIWRAPSLVTPHGHEDGIPWVRLQDEVALAKWETAWRESAGDTSLPTSPPLFLPSLLAHPEIAFVAAYDGDKIIAGAIANRTDHVIGLSNVFTPPTESVPFWSGCVATVTESFPGLPLVGYESGPELAVAGAVGFENLQNLRVWIHPKE